MARVVIPIVTIPNQGAIENLETFAVASDTANNHTLDNDGKVELHVYNQAVGALQVTVVSVAEPGFGRTGDLVDTVAAAGGRYSAGPFKPSGWNQGGTSLINIDVDTTDAAMLLVGVRRSNASS